MNDWDKNNYDYIMRLSEEDYDMFLETASEDDLSYLQEIMDQKKVDLQMSIHEYEDKLASIDVSQAQQFLRKFML
jgi:DNA repair photolyase